MTVHHEKRVITRPRERLFDLVADVESYPQFLPMWRRARVLNHDGDSYVTEQEIGFGPVRERFRTRTMLDRPQRIRVTSADGLFRAFDIWWEFDKIRGGCRVGVTLNWEVHSPLLQRAIDAMLPSTAKSMIAAFERRAYDGS